MRMPNGYGSVTKLSGKRRNPNMVRITVGVDEDTGDLVRKVLGYYPRRSDALSALAELQPKPLRPKRTRLLLCGGVRALVRAAF